MPARAAPSATMLSFQDLAGWAESDQGAALSVFLTTCGIPRDPEGRALCRIARDQALPNRTARAFFETFFRPVLIGGEDAARFTGYFEPELAGALAPDDRYRFPVYALPPDLPTDGQGPTRAEIDGGALADRGLEIAWVDDPVDLFFLQIQGSGRIHLPDGNVLRLGFAGHNGHPYQSVGEELVRRGVFQPHEASAAMIRSWVRDNPDEGRELLQHNASYVFFRMIEGLPSRAGPIGAMNRSLTPRRSIAVDPAYVPLGAPVWVEKAGDAPFERLMIAQDTGSAIKGPQRADIFFGTGNAAGRQAGRVRDGGRMVVLLPIQRAYAMAEGN
nr:MltA domain-containing protein [Tropicimonas sp. IMCC34043]